MRRVISSSVASLKPGGAVRLEIVEKATTLRQDCAQDAARCRPRRSRRPSSSPRMRRAEVSPMTQRRASDQIGLAAAIGADDSRQARLEIPGSRSVRSKLLKPRSRRRSNFNGRKERHKRMGKARNRPQYLVGNKTDAPSGAPDAAPATAARRPLFLLQRGSQARQKIGVPSR